MKTVHARAFTRIDLAILIATVGMIAVWAAYAPWRTWRRPHRCGIGCTSNLKQIGLGFRMWSNDHENRFPWETPAADGGTKEFAGIPIAALHFIVVSNELNSPKVLVCSSDNGRTRTTNWSLQNSNLSYFAGLSADETKPNTILSGDRNISTNSKMLTGILTVQDAAALRWTKDIHKGAGNIGLADGSVAQLATRNVRKTLQNALDASTNTAVRLVIP
jgi:prepilin-type processing-associated H-X9-DG protein